MDSSHTPIDRLRQLRQLRQRAPRIVLLAALCLGACAHASLQGTVLATAGETEARVRLVDGADEVHVGTLVNIRRRVCERDAENAEGERCRTKTVGRAEVTRILGGGLVMIATLDGTALHEGDRVGPI